MFCPVCKAEYRPGFTRCPDCDADLVERLESGSSPGVPEFDNAYEMLWSGNDPRIFQEFRDALQSAGISFLEQAPGPKLMYRSMRPPKEIWTRYRDHDAVDKVRKWIYGDDDGSNQNAGDGSDSVGGGNVEGQTDTDPEERQRLGNDYFDQSPALGPIRFAEDATAEVWSGGDVEMAQMLRASLRENGIDSVMDELGGKRRLRVMPEAETQAKEIIREVIEETPLE